jgi:hypothetical protein
MLQSADHDQWDGEMRTLTYCTIWRCRNASHPKVTLPCERTIWTCEPFPFPASNSPNNCRCIRPIQPNQSINQHEMAYLINPCRSKLL